MLAAAALLALPGCGSDDEPSATTAPEDGGGVVVAALGDSISAGNPAYDPDPGRRAALGFGDDERSQYESWAERADPRLSFRNCGVFGQRTDEIAPRLDACAEGAEALIVQGGINDIAQGRPLPAAAADLRAMAERGLDLGLDVLLVDVLPWNNGHPAADRPIAELNRRIEAIGRDLGVDVIGFHDALEDPGRPGVMAPRLTADGDHPSIAGYRLLGARAADALER
ncbi:MAG: GDSL-type esterase/lipase family protein [Solirubrobacterales bacterium]